MTIYKSNLITMQADWVLRRSYINNQGWQAYKKEYLASDSAK